ncbi:MAG: cbb3-type cytochrome c oxidase N-terminal domain-containing protein [Bacteroidota bacterium]
MRLNNKISLIIAAAILLLPSVVLANVPSGQAKDGGYNMVLISLIGLMLVLLFVIWMLASTLRQLATAVRDKMRIEKDKASGVIKAMLLFFALSIPSLNAKAAAVADTTSKAIAPVSKYIDGIAKDDFYTIMMVIALELIVVFALVIYIRMLLRGLNSKVEVPGVVEPKKSWFWDEFNAAASIEKEKDILLDHNYDGIQELDNSLPPWWKYGFYLTIIVGVIYLYRFHVSHDGMSQKEEYAAEMQKGEDDKAAYLAKSANNVDENTVTLLTDPTAIGEGKDLFQKNCIACHLADGGGVVGPNLTDEYWLHGGGIKDIFKTIKYGWQDKGMKSWKDDFSPKQIQELASFVKSLRGTHPATPKAPQGELYIEAGSESNKADSSKR